MVAEIGNGSNTGKELIRILVKCDEATSPGS